MSAKLGTSCGHQEWTRIMKVDNKLLGGVAVMDLTPALIINIGSGIFIGDFWGFILSLLLAPFLAFWLSAVKSRWRLSLLGKLESSVLGPGSLRG